MKRQARRTVQALTLVLLVLIPVLNGKGITVLSGTLYSLAVGPVWITDPLIGLQTILTALSLDVPLLLSLLIPVIFAFVLGRVFCGWVCPQNTLSEIVDAAAIRLKIRRRFRPPVTPVPRYIVLAVIVVLLPVTGLPLASLLSAPGIISVQTAQIVSHGTIGLELALIGLIIVAEFFLVRRAWCNYLCPVGTFLSLFRTPLTLKVVFSPGAERPCGGCLNCVAACQLGLDPLQGPLYPQCHNCGACINVCSRIKGKKNPLDFRF